MIQPIKTNIDIKSIADQYQDQERLEKKYREDMEREIKRIEKMISESINTSIYFKIYKEEYGDYDSFIQEVASELRRRNCQTEKK